MRTRLIRICISALFAAALAYPGAALAQDEDEASEEDDESDPCAGMQPPCGDGDDSGGGGGGGGDDGDDSGSSGDDGETASAGDGEGNGDDGETGSDGDGGDTDTSADASVEGSSMGPTLPEGKLFFSAAVQVNMTDTQVADPLSIAPDAWYGVNNKLSAGIVTSIQGQSGFWSGQAGTGICPVGDGCANVFDNVGAEALYALSSDPSLGFAVDVGFHALSIDATIFSGKVGAKGFWRSGKISVGFAPSVLIGVTERGAGNKETLNFPVDLSFMLSQEFHVGVQSGITTPFEAIGDTYRVPVALGALYMINPQIMAAAAFSLDRVAGGTPEGQVAPGAAANRSIYFMLGYTM